MTDTTIVGIDPGIRTTGMVVLRFAFSTVYVHHYAFDKKPAKKIKKVFDTPSLIQHLHPYVFIEKYRPRSNFSYDSRMIEVVADIRSVLPGSKLIDTSGIKTRIRPSVLETFQCDSASVKIPTHHDDVTSAARIALLGAYKDPELNKLIYDTLLDPQVAIVRVRP